MYYGKLYRGIPATSVAEKLVASRFFSVIVIARNEAAGIARCLLSIVHQNYPLSWFELIVIDDHSTDDTFQIVQTLSITYPNIRLYRLSELVSVNNLSYKKKGIAAAIEQAKGSWIVVTDADCIVPPQWLAAFHEHIESTHCLLVAAPVRFITYPTALSIFQTLDFMSLQGMTAVAAHNRQMSMCNGANLAYSKAAFIEVGGFDGIDHLPTGDDMLLMHKMAVRFPNQTSYLQNKNSIVLTEPMPTLSGFMNQRIRWASKANTYKDKRITYVLVLVYMFNSWFLMAGIGCIFYTKMKWLVLGGVILKSSVELCFMLPVARFYGQTKWLYWFVPMQPLHILYTLLAGWLGKFGKYKWKGRVVG